MSPPERVRSGITDMRVLATKLMEQAHHIAYELRTALLDVLGLESAPAALRRDLDSANRHHGNFP